MKVQMRKVIIKAKGRSFSAGKGLTEASSGDHFTASSVADRDMLRSKISEMQKYVYILEKCRKPVIPRSTATV